MASDTESTVDFPPSPPLMHTPETSDDEYEHELELAQPLFQGASLFKGEEEEDGNEQKLEAKNGEFQVEASGVDAKAASKFTQEGLRLARRLWNEFWDEERMHFRARAKSAETIDDWNGYTCWAYIIGLEAILEAEKAAPGRFRKEALKALVGLEKHYSPEHKGYCAWVWFPGNGDIYIDDNAQVAILLALAHRILPAPQKNDGLPYTSYLTRAKEIVSFCASAWEGQNGGGIRWHISTEGPPSTNRNACSTSLTAVGALEVAAILRKQGNTGAEFEGLVALGRKCLYWVADELVAQTNGADVDYWLVRDGWVQDTKGGPWRVEKTTYTYNTGHTITGLTLLYDLESNSKAKDTAKRAATSLVTSAVARERSLYDLTVPQSNARYWWDNNFFVHLLVEGLVVWSKTIGTGSHSLIQVQVNQELVKQMNYCMSYLKDPGDGLYFRNFRLYTITATHLSVYKQITGDTNRAPQYDGAERVMDDRSMSLPVEQRDTIKTLLGCGGAARAFLIAGRIV